jgi:hypothetical protein
MKKTLTLITLMAGAVGGYAQGTLAWGDYIGSGTSQFTITVWSPNPSAPTVQQIGNSSTDASPTPGSTVYGGAPLGGAATGTGATAYGNGNAYTIALYASTSSSTAVTPTTADEVVSSTFENMGGTGKSNILESTAFGGGPGYAGAWTANFGSENTTALPGTLTGTAGSAQVMLAAWYSGGGITSYSAAVTAGVPAGTSEIGMLSGLGGLNSGGPPSTAPDLAGLGITSFSLVTPVTTPEPSTIALGVIGASAFLMRLRRKV